MFIDTKDGNEKKKENAIACAIVYEDIIVPEIYEIIFPEFLKIMSDNTGWDSPRMIHRHRVSQRGFSVNLSPHCHP